MRKTIFFLAFVAVALLTNAQEAAEIKNAGNEALRSNDYKAALEKFEAYLTSGEEGTATDKATIFNAGVCGYKLNDFAKATKYFEKAISLNYKADYATYQIARMLQKQGDQDGYLAKLAEGLGKYPKSKYKKYYLAGLTKHYNKLASEPYNKGNALFTEGAVSGDYATYMNKAKAAKPFYEEARKAFAKTLEFDPTNATAKAAIANMDTNEKTFTDYKKSVMESQN